MTKTYSTREAWLVAAIEQLRPLFEEHGAEIPAVRVSVGWPGGRGKKNGVIGQCWHGAAAADGVAQVFVSPVLDDGLRVLDVLAHELIHAIHGPGVGHKGAFAKLAKAIGLEGKMTATVAGETLAGHLGILLSKLGAYPHAALAQGDEGAVGPKEQGTRMIKAECPHGTGYKVRMTRQWIDEVGAPICPCHGDTMEVVR